MTTLHDDGGNVGSDGIGQAIRRDDVVNGRGGWVATGRERCWRDDDV